MSVPVTFNLSNKPGVIGIPRSKLVQNAVLDSAFKTHKNLSVKDRTFAIKQILSLDLSDQELANFVLQIYKLSMTGRFSLTYNLDLDTHIKARLTDRIKTLVGVAGTDKAWPELYDNCYLCDTHIADIKNASDREYYAILNTIQTARSQRDFENILPCVNINQKKLTVTDQKIYYNSIYSKCYNNICLSESEQKGKIISLHSGTVPKVAYVESEKDQDKKEYCLSFMSLIKQLATDNTINPETGTRFSDRTIGQLMNEYTKEVFMYKKYLDILKEAGINPE
jgi:hypothetical protein